MRNALLLHGCCNKDEFCSDKYPSSSNSHWFGWLQKQLIKQGIETQTPEMPTPYAPEYREWKRVFEQFEITSETTLVGHSCAAGFLLRWLGDNPNVEIDKLLLVAPWLDPIKKRKGFLDFEINPQLDKQVKTVHVFYSHDDPVAGVRESYEEIRSTFPKAKVTEYENMGHFILSQMQTEKFPDLLEVIQA